MPQTTFDTTDYGEMTLGQLDEDGIEFLLEHIEKTKGQWGDFVVLTGKLKSGEEYEIRAGGRAGKMFLKEGESMIGKLISIKPSGEGLQRKYRVKILS